MNIPVPAPRRAAWPPTALTALRFPLAILFIVLQAGTVRLAIVAAAAASDLLDGPWARRSGRTSRVGELLDPIADRTFVLVALLTLALEGTIPLWTLPLLLLRDIGVTLGALLVLARNRHARLPARAAGKRVTFLQMTATAGLILRPGLAPVLASAVAVLGVIALRDYVRAARTRPRAP